MDKNLTINDFMLLSVIGKGSYAKVLLVKKKDTGEIMALKVLKKEMVERRKQEEHVKTERDVLVDAIHPFIAKLHCSFQNEKKLFFALEYCPGGELFNLLQKRKYFTEDQTRFYACQIVLALEYLHSKDVIYRDLKPENVLIDKDGYIRITDFGLSKKNVKGTKDAHSVCGTPEYLAPEVILKKGHGKAVDWWTFGSIMYEMLTGLPPFYTSDREELFERIKLGSVKYPSNFSPSLKDLLTQLFIKDPEKRLGSGSDGPKNIKKHAWFSGVNWDDFLKKSVRAPFKPVIKGDLDVSNFDPEFTETDVESVRANNLVGSTSYGTFENFTYDESEMNKAETGN
jgi:serum/glucocorticoid-regulated kinase 2